MQNRSDTAHLEGTPLTSKNVRLKFETERLKDGPIVHELDVHPELLELVDDPEYNFKEPVTGRLSVQLAGTTVLITGFIKTFATAPCARCLHELRVPLQTDVTIVFMQDERLLDSARYPELVDDNTHWYDGMVVHPGPQLRELLLLQLPTVSACELEPGDICPIRHVKLEPMVFGPADTEPEAPAAPAPGETESFADKMKRLRREIQE